MARTQTGFTPVTSRHRLVFLAILCAFCAQGFPEEAARRAIVSKDAPTSTGPYSQAIAVDGTVYVSGQLGVNPRTGQLAADFKSQLRQVFSNLRAVLAAAAMTLEDTVQVQVFLADLNDYAALNEIYANYFKAPYPARIAVQVARLPRDARVEVALIAVRDPDQQQPHAR